MPQQTLKLFTGHDHAQNGHIVVSLIRSLGLCELFCGQFLTVSQVQFAGEDVREVTHCARGHVTLHSAFD